MKEVGELRKRLSGEEAKPYMGYARTLLGAMKEQMERGRLLQLQWTKDLPEGVRVTVMSIFGNDEIRIDVPLRGTVNPVGTVEEAQLDLDGLGPVIAVGYYLLTSYVGGWHRTDNPFIWTKQDGVIVLGTSDNYSGSVYGGGQCTAVSQDGSTIVGFLDGVSCCWDSKGTRIKRGPTLPAGWYPAVCDVSADGSVMVGIDYFATPATLFRWSDAQGLTKLDSDGGDAGVAWYGLFPRVSPNGEFSTANLYYTDLQASTQTVKGYVFDALGHRKEVPLGQAVDVNDNGIVLCTNGYGGDPAQFILWDCNTGKTLVTGDSNMDQPYAMSADATLVCGNFRPPDWPYSNAGMIPSLWTKQSGTQVIPPGIINYKSSNAYCMSDDGSVMGGTVPYNAYPPETVGYGGIASVQPGNTSAIWEINNGVATLIPVIGPPTDAAFLGITRPPYKITVDL